MHYSETTANFYRTIRRQLLTDNIFLIITIPLDFTASVPVGNNLILHVYGKLNVPPSSKQASGGSVHAPHRKLQQNATASAVGTSLNSLYQPTDNFC